MSVNCHLSCALFYGAFPNTADQIAVARGGGRQEEGGGWKEGGGRGEVGEMGEVGEVGEVREEGYVYNTSHQLPHRMSTKTSLRPCQPPPHTPHELVQLRRRLGLQLGGERVDLDVHAQGVGAAVASRNRAKSQKNVLCHRPPKCTATTAHTHASHNTTIHTSRAQTSI